MKEFNPELNKDITALKILYAKKDKSAFNKLKSELMQKHCVSKATIYRELKKDMPGNYTKPKYSPAQRPITEKEILMVQEMLIKKIPVMSVGRLMEEETGEKYNWDRIDKIRRIADARINDLGEASGLNAEFETSFGDPIRRLTEQALKLNKMASNSYITFMAEGKTYRLNYYEAKDIALICAGAIARSGAVGCNDMVHYSTLKFRLALTDKIRMIDSSTPTREISALIKEFNKIKTPWEMEITRLKYERDDDDDE
jgi:hypothetical protein